MKKPEEILRIAREAKGMTQTQVAEKLGIGLRMYQKIEDGNFPKYKTGQIVELDKILDTKLYELIYEQNDTKGDNKNYIEERRKIKIHKTGQHESSKQLGIPIYDVPIDASFLERYRDDGEGYEPIGFLNIPKLRNCNFAAIISGNSMYPLMKSGSIAACRIVENLDYFDEGEMYFVSTSNGFETVKYVQSGENPDELKLIPHNEKIKATTIKKEMVLRMCIVEAWLNFR